jgi:hypothetical protein
VAYRDLTQLLKQETSAGGGTAGDETPYPSPINASQDAIECAGVVLNDWNGGTPVRDQTVYVRRDGNNLIVNAAGYVTLAVAGTEQARIGATYVAVGANPAPSGSLRLPNVSSLQVMGGDGSTSRSLLSHTSDTATLGNATTVIEVASRINRGILLGTEDTLWKLDEGASPYANSGSSGSNNVIANSPYAYPTDSSPFGTCVLINELDSANYLKSTNTGPALAYPISLTIWYKTKTTGGATTNPIFAKYYAAASFAAPIFAIGIHGTSILNASVTVAGVRSSCALAAPHFLGAACWFLLGLTYDGTTLKLYRDGQLVASTAVSGAIDYGSTPGYWALGNRYDTATTPITMSLARATVHNVALTQAQMLRLYMAGRGWFN